MSGVISHMTITGRPVLQPDALEAEAMRLRASPIKWKDRANSVTMYRGLGPSVAFVLVSADVFDNLNLDQPQYLELITEPRGTSQADTAFRGNRTILVPDMYIHRADAVLAGDSDVKGPYLLELRDPRQLFYMSAINQSYNVLRPDEAGYWASTTDSATPWSWSGMIDDIRSKLYGNPTLTTAFADFPATDPEDFRFQGESAWIAMGRVAQDLGHLILPKIVTGQQVAWNWYFASPNYEDTENAQIAADAIDLAYNPVMTTTRVPANFAVTFPDRDYGYHVDSDGQVYDSYDAFNAGPTHVESVSTKLGLPGTSVTLQDSLPVRRDPVSGAIINQSDLSARAAKLASLYATRMTGADMDNYYAGLHPFSPDGLIDVVTWFDYGDGWQTRTSAGPAVMQRNNPWHYLPQNAESSIPHHRKVFGRVTTANIFPGQTGNAVAQFLNGSGNWQDTSPIKNTAFRNVGLDPIVADDRVYIEWWWQRKEWIALCGFRTSS